MRNLLLDAGSDFGRGLDLSTRDGNPIPNRIRMPSTPAQIVQGLKLIEKSCAQARLRSKSSIYNCVGLVFASRRTWIDSNQIAWILKEDGYRSISDIADAVPGDIVVYKDTEKPLENAHIGVILGERPLVEGSLNSQTWVISQFGDSGEWLHPINSVPPHFRGGMEFWTERI